MYFSQNVTEKEDNNNWRKYKLIGSSTIYNLATLLWLFAVLVFLKIFAFPLGVVFIIVIASHFLLVVNRVERYIYMLPFVIILAPIFGSIKFFGLNILFSDLLILFSFAVLITFYHKEIKGSSRFYLFIFFLLSHFLFHVIIGDIVSIKPLISVIEIFILYSLTKNCSRRLNNNQFFTMVIFAVVLGILLMFLAFYKGINLNDFTGNSSTLILDAEDFNIENYRMSFFYTNFPFLISSLIFILLYKLSLYKSLIMKGFCIISLIVICISIIASGNKTTLLASMFIFIISNIIFHNKGMYRFTNFIYLAIFIPVVYFFIYNFYLSDINSESFTNRMISADSFIDRLGVYVNVFYILLENPHRILIGYGPDFLTGGGHQLLAAQFKINYYTKAVQGAVDSGIITFIIEFGLLVFSMIAFFIFSTIRQLYRNQSALNILLIQIILLYIVSGATQVVGLSKIFWFFVVIYAIARFQVTKDAIASTKEDNSVEMSQS